jgi:predicted glycosyltransferase
VRIWIDLSNSPHPLLFAPIARRLEELGHEVGITARDNAQTVELTLERWPDATIIGGESPKSRHMKTQIMAQRVTCLRRWARSFRADVALSHNSYAQILAARTLGLRVVTAMDYEGQPANHLAFRLAHVILMPEALRHTQVRSQGATVQRTHFYPGFKEQIYLGDFEPDPRLCDSLGVSHLDVPLVVARTPPSRASYHQFGNQLFDRTIRTLGEDTNARVVVLVRHEEQRDAIRALNLGNIVVPEHAIDSLSLIHQADLVIGAGGTMTREAALMGIPTYSLFAGRQPAVDRQLEARGYLRRLAHVDDLMPLQRRLENPRPKSELCDDAASLVAFFVRTALAETPWPSSRAYPTSDATPAAAE